jgi:hypothetical protein
MQVTIRDAGDLKVVNRALRQAANGKQLRKELGQNLRGQIRPIVARVKVAWRTAPSKGRPHPGRPPLRRLLANATRGQVRLAGKEAGIRVRTDGRRMPDQMKALPTYAEGTKRPWRSPVFGDRDTWVTHQPFPQFYDAVRPDEARARREVEKAVEAVFKQIVRAR